MEPTVEDLERRMAGLEKAVHRQRLVISGLLLAVVAAVTMAAAPQSKNAEFDTVTAKKVEIVNQAGNSQVTLDTDYDGGIVDIYNTTGMLQIGLAVDDGGRGGRLQILNSAEAKQVELSQDKNGGVLSIYKATGKIGTSLDYENVVTERVSVVDPENRPYRMVSMSSVEHGGIVGLYRKSDRVVNPQIALVVADDGGYLQVYNKTGEGVVEAYADEYGNGLVGAWDRKGKGRTLKPR